MNAQQKYVERSEKMKNEFKEGLINDETFSDKELLFDDWEVRNPTFYSRERKKYVIFLHCYTRNSDLLCLTQERQFPLQFLG